MEDEAYRHLHPGKVTPPDPSLTKRKELGLSCMLNTEVGAVLAVVRRPIDPSLQYLSPNADPYSSLDSSILHSLKSLRSLIFNPQQEWRSVDPSIYLSPFLDVVQSDEVPAPATAVVLSSILKILKAGIFDEKTIGARDAVLSVVSGVVNCRLERTDSYSEDAVLMRILHVLSALMRHRASVLLSDQAVCTIVNTCFQVVQQSATRGDLLQRNAMHTMHELIQIVFSRLPVFDTKDGVNYEPGGDDFGGHPESGYGVRCTIDIFQFLCSLLNATSGGGETEGTSSQAPDEDVQLFALMLINSAIELSGDSMSKHPKLLQMIQDDLFRHLVYYGVSSSQLVLTMICSTVLSTYHFLRRFIRLQLEAFFKFVLFRASSIQTVAQVQEVAMEGLINFCRQPTFIFEAYANYDCSFICMNIFEEIGKLLCKHAFPSSNSSMSLQIQAFEGLVIIIHNIADNVTMEGLPSSFAVPPTDGNMEYRPFWEEKMEDDKRSWIESLRVRKMGKRKVMIAGNHFNRDEKKGLEYLKLSGLVSNPIDPKAYAYFFRFSPGLDKNFIGDFLGDPDEFHMQVLKEFTETFEFRGMVLDVALRTYLETFRLPGESQKIQRILEAFADRFFDQQSSDIFVSKDAVVVFCYSLIMLNTDQHNPQVKKKMTEEEFIRNNRGINGGNDLPREYLSELFLSISTNAIKLDNFGTASEMSQGRWIELANRSKSAPPFVQCCFDGKLGRDMFAAIAGPSVATLCACFENTDEDDLLHECVEGLFSIAKIAQYGLGDTLDELLASFCKFTTLLNPYASAEETLFAFSNDMKPRMATLAVFTIANSFGYSIRGGWRNIVDCLLKLKRLKLLPQSMFEPDSTSSPEHPKHMTSESVVIFPNQEQKPSMMGRFSNFLAVDSPEDSLSLGNSEFEQNLKVIKQCRIGSLFTNSSVLPDEALLHLGRSLIYAAAGRGQKFSTPVEEEESVGFCWELIVMVTSVNLHRFSRFWPSYHDTFIAVAQSPLFSPIPFAEKGIVSLFKVCLRLLTTPQNDFLPEELIFKSINVMWKLDKEILDTCCGLITNSTSQILLDHPGSLQSHLGWKSVLHLVSVTGRQPETYDQGVETLISFLSDGSHLSKMNYPYCIDCAFSFVALKNSPLEKNLKILDLLADSVNYLVQWHKSGFSDPGNSFSAMSNASTSSMEDNANATKNLSSSSFALNFFVKLGETLRKMCLARREEIRNHSVASLEKSFRLAEDLDFSSTNCMSCFTLVIFATVDDVHEKMLEYSRRENSEREMRSMEGTLSIAMEMLVNSYLHYLRQISENSGFRTFWLGVLRRMDTCMKADLGAYGESITLKDAVPELLRKMITRMKNDGILAPKDDDDLWEVTDIQIQWIAPSLKDELFPDY
ncbi:hypothetical protein MLD38_015326 [Melastoma candidum]|uniref:Uncharacterized protein n=1 Tax=Melastoma candidum TaxID=119954 RepID=A0ACB9RJX5_9MYRT|nr:hypothetical protein MLD38_015326 [Melastoma candidum]